MALCTIQLKLGLVIGAIGVILGTWMVWKTPSQGIIKKPEQTYDFIIVGAGTAGSVLASRLSENPSFKILLIEAGGEEPWLSSIPIAVPLLQRTSRDWQYKTVAQKDANGALLNRESFWPRGKVLGGSGQLNYNIHMYGSSIDYDLWATEYGAKDWGYDEMKKFHNKAECREVKGQQFQDHESKCSTKSPLDSCSQKKPTGHRRISKHVTQCENPPVRKTVAHSILSKALLDAGREIGLPVGNLNENIDYGVMAAESTVYNGKKWTTMNSYLRPVLGKENLHVMINTQVSTVIWDGKRAIGVDYFQDDNLLTNGSVYAKGEVILSCGSINTPVLLIHSGIGPKDTLQKLQIPEVSTLEGVGENLQDHLNLPLYVSLKANVSLNVAKLKTFSNLWNYFLYGEGDFGRSAIEGVVTSPINGENPEIQLILLNMGSVDKTMYTSIANIRPEVFDSMFPGMNSDSSEGFIFLASCLHPKSRGRLIVNSKSSKAKPLIDPKYLQHPYDVNCTKEAYKLALKLTETKALQSLGASLNLPNYKECISGTITDIDCIVRTFAVTGYHPIGTARIGKPDDPLAVVDAELKVRGVESLRIVDASVMPTQISGTPNSAIISVAEKAADLLRKKWIKSRT